MDSARRRFLRILFGSIAGLQLSTLVGASERKEGRVGAVFLIPGYQPHRADDVSSQIPPGYRGTQRLVTRIDAVSGKVSRTVLPCRGHQIVVAPDRSKALFCPLGEPQTAVFDPASLQLITLLDVHAPGFIGGGHGLFTPDGHYFISVERTDYAPFSGKASNHYGRIVIRDAGSLAIAAVHSCYGIRPHEIALLDNGRHMAVANYGSTDWPEGSSNLWPYVVEPSVTLVDLRSGKLAAIYVAVGSRYEIRHLVVKDMNNIFAIQAHEVGSDQAAYLMRDLPDPGQDHTVEKGFSYAPAPLLGLHLGGERRQGKEVVNGNPLMNRQGQSLLYDSRHDEVITTYTSSHAVQVSSGTGVVKTTVATDQLGLHYPRGVALHPDGRHYLVSGSWRNIYAFERGTHKLHRELCRYETLYGHSHLTVI